MPNFKQYDVPVETEVEVNINVDVQDFLYECDAQEIEEVIEYLNDKGHINKSYIKKQPDFVCATEQEFVNALVILSNKWNLLSKEEEETILNLAKRF